MNGNLDSANNATLVAGATEERVAKWNDSHYKPERLNSVDGRRERLIADRLSDLTRDGYALISRHDSLSGRAEWLTTSLNNLPGQFGSRSSMADVDRLVVRELVVKHGLHLERSTLSDDLFRWGATDLTVLVRYGIRGWGVVTDAVIQEPGRDGREVSAERLLEEIEDIDVLGRFAENS
jgi:hypothetical protein